MGGDVCKERMNTTKGKEMQEEAWNGGTELSEEFAEE